MSVPAKAFWHLRTNLGKRVFVWKYYRHDCACTDQVLNLESVELDLGVPFEDKLENTAAELNRQIKQTATSSWDHLKDNDALH